MRLQDAGAHLRSRIEGAQAFELVAEEIEPQPFVEAAREDIDDRTADCIFTRVDHRVAARVALPLKEAGEALASDFDTRFELAHALADAERGQHALQDGVDRRDEQLSARFADLQPVQGGEAPRADRQGGAGAVVGQAVPRRKLDDFQFGREILRGIGDTAHRYFVGRDEDGAALCGAGEVGHDERLRPLHHAGEGQRLVGGQYLGEIRHQSL